MAGGIFVGEQHSYSKDDPRKQIEQDRAERNLDGQRVQGPYRTVSRDA